MPKFVVLPAFEMVNLPLIQFSIAMSFSSTVKYFHTAGVFLCVSFSNRCYILLLFTAINSHDPFIICRLLLEIFDL